MKHPNKQKCLDLLSKTHIEGVPNWSTKETQEAYDQFKDLFEHWFRRELHGKENKSNL